MTPKYTPDGKIEKTRKATKRYKCDCCGEVINKGSHYIHGNTRAANYDENDKQIGVEFIFWRLHLNPDFCQENIDNKEMEGVHV